MLLKESFSYNSVSLRLWAILWPFKQWDWHRGPQLCLADDLRKNNWLSTLSNLPKGFVCAGPEARNTPASQILLPHNKLVYLVLGLRKGKKPRRATEKKLNVSGNVSELFCKLLVWDLKKKKEEEERILCCQTVTASQIRCLKHRLKLVYIKGQLLANSMIVALQGLLFCSVVTCPAPNSQKQKSVSQIFIAIC